MICFLLQDVQKEQNNREESKNSIQQTAERLLSKPNISKPNSETIQTRLDILLTRWDILRADVATRTRGVESKLRRVSEFLGDLEELSSWAATTRELLEKQEGGIYNQEVVDPKVCLLCCFKTQREPDGNTTPPDNFSEFANLCANFFFRKLH